MSQDNRKYNKKRNYSKGNRRPQKSYDPKANEYVKMYKEVEDESKLEGRNSVEEALEAGRGFENIWYLKPQSGKKIDDRLGAIIEQLRDTNARLHAVERKTLDRMAVTHNHQGIIAEVETREYAEVSDILRLAEQRGEVPFILILDELQDAQNLGAILRTADAAGIHGVIIPIRRSVALDATVAKTSVGAIEHVLVARVNNLNQTISELKDQGLWIGGLDVPGENIFESDFLKQPLALVVGNEGDGISPSVSKNCDFLLEIPMHGQINSLNASNAAAVAMYAVLNKRG